MFFKNAVILIFFILLNAIQTESLSFPIYSTKNLPNCTTTEEILDYFKNNKIYSFIQIGDPPKKMPIIFTSHDSTSIIKKEDCPITSEYDINFSKGINILYDELNKRFFYIKDYISFEDKNKSILMNFIYYNQTDIKEGNCGFIGIQNIEPEEKNNYNFFFQLKDMNIINKTIFYFNFSDNNNVFLNIGVEPYEINPKLYSEKNKKIIDVDYVLDYEKKHIDIRKYKWNLNFSQVFYFKKLPIQSSVDPYSEVSRKNTRRVDFFQAMLMPEEDLIKGPFEYMELIDNDFFLELIKNNICKKINFDRKFYYVCQKEHQYLLEKTFPSLYFYSNKLNYIFELNYKDLFIEQGEYLIFGIYFNYFETELFVGAFLSEWYFGRIFLKKYCFSFDFENGKIIFYKQNIAKNKRNKKKENPKEEKNVKFYQLGLIVVVIGIGIIAFIYERMAKRKYRIDNSLIDYKLNV